MENLDLKDMVNMIDGEIEVSVAKMAKFAELIAEEAQRIETLKIVKAMAGNA